MKKTIIGLSLILTLALAGAALARGAGFQVVSLGPRRLKVPTAALAAITLIQYAWGDLA